VCPEFDEGTATNDSKLRQFQDVLFALTYNRRRPRPFFRLVQANLSAIAFSIPPLQTSLIENDDDDEDEKDLGIAGALGDERRDELDVMLGADRQETGHVRWTTTSRSKDLRTLRKESLKPARGDDNPLTRYRLANVLKGMDSPALSVNNASRRQRLRPLAIGQKPDTALHDKKHFVFILVPVRRRAATWWGGAQGDDHQAIGLLTTKLDLRGVAIGVKCPAAVGRDDESLRRRGSIGDNRGLG
jgi:hypothetical protein